MNSCTVEISSQVPRDRLPRLQPGKTVQVRLLSDLRGKDPDLIMDKLNLNKTIAQGAYLSAEPVALVVGRALEQALEAAGARTVDAEADLILSGSLRALDFAVMVGFSQCMLKSSLSLDLALTPKGSGKPAWQGSVTGWGGAGTGSLVPQAFHTAMADAMVRLLNDPDFSGAFL